MLLGRRRRPLWHLGSRLTKNEMDWTRKTGWHPPPPFCVSAHSRSLRLFIFIAALLLRVLTLWRKKAANTGGFQGREAVFPGSFATESIRNQGTRARGGDAARSWGRSRNETADPQLAPVPAKSAHAGNLVIVRDDSGATRWIEEIGKIGTEKGSMRDISADVKMRSTSIYSMVYSNNWQGGRPVKSFEPSRSEALNAKHSNQHDCVASCWIEPARPLEVAD